MGFSRSEQDLPMVDFTVEKLPMTDQKKNSNTSDIMRKECGNTVGIYVN